MWRLSLVLEFGHCRYRIWFLLLLLLGGPDEWSGRAAFVAKGPFASRQDTSRGFLEVPYVGASHVGVVVCRCDPQTNPKQYLCLHVYM